MNPNTTAADGAAVDAAGAAGAPAAGARSKVRPSTLPARVADGPVIYRVRGPVKLTADGDDLELGSEIELYPFDAEPLLRLGVLERVPA